jgi:hypothetical protein
VIRLAIKLARRRIRFPRPCNEHAAVKINRRNLEIKADLKN